MPQGSPENRPCGVTSKPAMRVTGTAVVIPRRTPFRQIVVYTKHHLGGGYGDAGMRPERRPRRGHRSGRHRRPGMRMLARKR